MSRRNYKESGIPENLYVQVRYDKGKDFWRTFATIKRRDNDDPVAMASSFCNPKDNPNRKIGRAIAIGRAMKKYWERADGD